MKNSAMLRTARVGGFNKEDVLIYVDELNAKIDSLKAELEKAKVYKEEAAEAANYKNDNERLKERLSETEEKLSEVRTDADSLKIEMQNEIDSLAAENRSLKNEMESLRYQLDNTQSVQNTAPSAADNPSFDTSEFEYEIRTLKAKLDGSHNQITEMSSEIARLKSDNESKERKIQKLTQDNNDLRLNSDNGFSNDFDMGALFSEAQATAKRIIVEARMAADKIVSDANAESDKIISGAEKKAEEMEKESREKTQFTVNAAEKLKTLFKSEMEILSGKLSYAMEEIEVTSKKLSNSIESTKNSLNENVDNFINGSDGLEKVLDEAAAASPSVSVKEPEGLSDFEYTPVSSEEMPPVSDDVQPVSFLDDLGYTETAEAPNEETDDESFGEADENQSFGSEFESYSVGNDIDDDSYIGSSYIPGNDFADSGISDENDVIGQNTDGNDKDIDNIFDDVLGSFAIDPIPDEDEENPEPPKVSHSLGFDLGDLEKLAAEAEKDI